MVLDFNVLQIMKKKIVFMPAVAIVTMGLLMLSCGNSSKPQTINQEEKDSIVETKRESVSNVESDKILITEFYQFVFGKKEMKDEVLDKYLSAELKKSLWTEDYEGCYEYWLFRTSAQDSKPDNDVSKIESIKELGEGWYVVKYLDMGWNGTTKVKVIEDKIVEFVKDKSWDEEY